ncbi:MAG: NADH-quinone oxidoreductase subunit I [Akkermansiaceae bacterium]|nr:NADH-quinone oxidoreductase subunit I [Akkermansiaceae bacterium]
MPGLGLFKGLAVTGKNFIQSYYKKDRMTTVQYPEARAPISPNFRNFPFLVYDETPEEGLRCTACSICEKSCPPQCIYIVMDRDENGKAKSRPKTFEIDLTVCMNCGICSEVCPFDSIYMDGEYELSADDRFGGLVFGLDKLAKSEEYHMKLRPEQATEVAASRKAAAEKKAAAAAAKAAKAKAAAEAKAKAKAKAKAAAEAKEEETAADAGGDQADGAPALPSEKKGDTE